MALIKCPDCQHEISDKSVTCPNCGLPDPEAVRKTQSARKPQRTGCQALLLPILIPALVTIPAAIFLDLSDMQFQILFWVSVGLGVLLMLLFFAHNK